MGVWNSHTSVGNILGALVAGWFVDTDWSLSFIVPGVIIIIMTFPLWLFLVPCEWVWWCWGVVEDEEGCWRGADVEGNYKKYLRLRMW